MLYKQLRKGKVFFDFNTISFSKKNVLIIDSILPEYDKDSGSRRLSIIIKTLLKKGYGVFLMADQLEYKYKTDYVSFYERLGVVVYRPTVGVNGEFITKELFLRSIIGKMQYAWLHRPDVFFKYSGFIEQKSKAMLIYDMVDFHYLRLKRKWEQNKNKTLEKKVDKYLNIETHCCKKAKKIITISEDDKEELLKYYSNASKMLTISNIHQHKATRINCFEKRKDLLFVGGFSHTPNVDAVKYLHDEIMPLVWKQDKNIKINIIGSYPTEEVKKLNSEKFNILGFVEDLEPFYRKSRLFVAPLRYGAGVKGKIGQSLEYSLPVITTSIGAEGFDFGKHKDVMVSDDKMQLVDNILNLYTKANLWQSVSGATSNILEPFSLEETEKKILEVLS